MIGLYLLVEIAHSFTIINGYSPEHAKILSNIVLLNFEGNKGTNILKSNVQCKNS